MDDLGRTLLTISSFWHRFVFTCKHEVCKVWDCLFNAKTTIFLRAQWRTLGCVKLSGVVESAALVETKGHYKWQLLWWPLCETHPWFPATSPRLKALGQQLESLFTPKCAVALFVLVTSHVVEFNHLGMQVVPSVRQQPLWVEGNVGIGE